MTMKKAKIIKLANAHKLWILLVQNYNSKILNLRWRHWQCISINLMYNYVWCINVQKYENIKQKPQVGYWFSDRTKHQHFKIKTKAAVILNCQKK